jgi:glycine oxidase
VPTPARVTAEIIPIEPVWIMPAKGARGLVSVYSPSPSSPRRVAVVGGGVIGLSIAWQLGRCGWPVDVFEAGSCGREASWAAAGMLAAQIEAEPTEEALLPLARQSQRLWPAFAQALERESGIDVGYRDEGTVMVALTRDDAEKLRFAYDLHRRMDLDIRWLSAAEVLAREPRLNPRVSAGLYCPGDGQVDNRLVVAALIAACRSSGCAVHEQTAIHRVVVEHGCIRGVTTEAAGGEPRFHPADIVVLAAGAWSRGIEGLPLSPRLPVRPVKGQMLALRMDPQAPLVRHVVWAPNAYLVPRRDGRLIIGATTEERGFDRSVTAGAMLALLDGAWRALPGVEELPIDEFWSGFRPGSRDDLPILGATEIDGLILATGHHRNGILLTPITAEAIVELVITGRTPPAIAPFALARFASAARKPA